jgi:hypothetical protein
LTKIRWKGLQLNTKNSQETMISDIKELKVFMIAIEMQL